MNTYQEFEGRVAVVTGAAGGIGLAAVRALRARGATVVAVDRSEGVHDLNESIGPEGMVTVVADVTRPDEVDSYVSVAREQLGTIDYFFNNAGIYDQPNDLADYPVESFARTLEVNILGVWLGLRAVLPVMSAQNRGAVVNTSSIAGLLGYSSLSGYVASKHAVLGLTKVAAAEGAASGVRVNAVCPGLIDTAMGQQVRQYVGTDFDDYVKQVTPLGREGTPEEVADAVCYLLSDQARFITGTELVVDGGITAVG